MRWSSRWDESQVPPLDDKDLRILDALALNGRLTNRALAKRIALSESACAARRVRLTRMGVIVGYSAKIALDRLGVFRTWADVVLVDDQPATVRGFETLLPLEPEILSADIIGGEMRLRLLVATANFERWESLCERLLARQDLVVRINASPIFRTCQTSGCLPEGLIGMAAR